MPASNSLFQVTVTRTEVYLVSAESVQAAAGTVQQVGKGQAQRDFLLLSADTQVNTVPSKVVGA